MFDMRRQNKPPPKQHTPPAPKAVDADEKVVEEAREKYRELYAYSTDVLLKEHERFNRADDKAAKYSTIFIFLIGVVAYFDKWIFDRTQWPDFPVELPPNLPLILAGLLALIASSAGLWLAYRIIKLQPIVSRPLDQKTLDFFENESRITVYYCLARENSKAYEKNKEATNKKYVLLKWTHFLMTLVLALLAELVVMYCLYSWC